MCNEKKNEKVNVQIVYNLNPKLIYFEIQILKLTLEYGRKKFES